MNLSIKYLPNLDRPFLIRRDGGTYEQHAHMRSKKDALTVRRLIDGNKYPYCEDYKIAMKRLLTEEEFKRLRKKDRYFNPQKGLRK